MICKLKKFWWHYIKRKSLRRLSFVLEAISIRMVKPLPVLCGKEGRKGGALTLNEYEEIIYLLKQEKIGFKEIDRLLEIFFSLKDATLLNYWEVVGGIRYAFNELEAVKKLFEGLERDPDPYWIAAGGDRLKAYGFWNVRVDLGEQFGIDPRKVGKFEMSEIFIILSRNGLKARILAEYQRLKQKQNG